MVSSMSCGVHYHILQLRRWVQNTSIVTPMEAITTSTILILGELTRLTQDPLDPLSCKASLCLIQATSLTVSCLGEINSSHTQTRSQVCSSIWLQSLSTISSEL